jgi:SAM-dependent methyltransferase
VSAPAAGFSASWLQQREPFDAAARDRAAPRLQLLPRLAAWRGTAPAPLRVLDLACGTGANLRWLAPKLGGAQQWLVVDHDAALLRCWPRALGLSAPPRAAGRTSAPLRLAGPGFQADIQRLQLDLAQALPQLPWPAVQLVTASALLDLVSLPWLQRLVAAATGAGSAWLMALSVDGRHRWSLADEADARVAALFAAHQQRHKGFGGPALGAAAGPVLQQLLRAAGYRVHTARSDWRLEGRSAPALALQRALIDGMAQAATEQAAAEGATVRAWQQRRQVLAPRTVLQVGHVEVLALPP